MSYENIREQIAAVLGSVDGAGVVHQYTRWAADRKKFLSLFQDPDGKINGWMITRERVPQRKVTQGEKERAHIFILRKIYGLTDDEASELSFQQHLEAVQNAFNLHETLNGSCESIVPDWGPLAGSAGLQIEGAGEVRMFGGVLCHYAECRLQASERIEDNF